MGWNLRRGRLTCALVGLALITAACTDRGAGGDDAAAPTSTATAPTSTTEVRDPDLCPDAPWMARGIGPSERAERLVAAMSLDQKLAQTHGDAQPEDFRIVPGVPELCVPDLTVTNGPAGVGPSFEALGGDPATALPAPLALAATWDPAMAAAFGDVMGAEMRQTGRNLLEAPDVDVARIPLNGRTFEAFGEDPLLVAAIAVPQIRAVQDHGIIAMAKHFVANAQETDRMTISAEVSERALHELYLAPFEAAVKDAEVASIMCAYNRVNGTHSCENQELLRGVLRDRWGFDGFVQSDFFAAHSTVPSVEAGMDLEMPMPEVYGQPLTDAVSSGAVSEERIDALLMPRFTKMFEFGLFDRVPSTEPIPVEEHAETAREIAAAGTVLLRNEGRILPLGDDVTSVAVVGPWADVAATGGGGSSKVNPIRTVTPIDGIRTRAGDEVEVIAVPGDDPAAAAAAAARADVAVVIVGEELSEAVDRTSLSLPDGQDALVAAVAAANPDTVVVLHTGAPVLMPWLESTAGVLMGWYPGGEDGTVTAELLFGDAEPGGRLPITFPASLDQLPTAGDPLVYPGNGTIVRHTEDLAIGYRHYLGEGVDPLFPFGFGLSYSDVELSGLDAPRSVSAGDTVDVDVTVENRGETAGSQVIQVYVTSPPEVGAPSAQLRGFAKVRLDAGATETVTIELDDRTFSHWDEAGDDWVETSGTYELLVGTSAVDTPLRAEIDFSS
ncbi:MAG: glycoside hydrolase family 3 C-terminal domain-containing protein [Actinomycetota bacterium]|nr:glycoside hydrolase family 3 C-terminal domain-containing protein [Actinomycetota bacterium]